MTDGVEKSSPSIGQIFKEARLSKGLTISDVVRETKIRYSHIQHIENDDYKNLPERTYTLGYIANYAKFLGLNQSEMIEKVNSQYNLSEPSYENMVQNKKLEKQYSPINVVKDNIIDFFFILISFGKVKNSTNKDSDKNFSNKEINNSKSKVKYVFIVIILIVLLLVFFVGWYFNMKKPTLSISEDPIEVNSNVAKELDFQNPENKDVTVDKDINEIINNDSMIILNKEDLPSNNNQNSLTLSNDLEKNKEIKDNKDTKVKFAKLIKFPKDAKKSNISIIFLKDGWMRIHDKNDKYKVYLDSFFKAGDTYEVPDVANLALDVKSYQDVIIKVKNKKITLTSDRKSKVLRNIVLDDSELLDKFYK